MIISTLPISLFLDMFGCQMSISLIRKIKINGQHGGVNNHIRECKK